MKNPLKIYAETPEEVEALARSYAAHGIRTAEDFAAYCRPPAWLFALSAVVFAAFLGALACVIL